MLKSFLCLELKLNQMFTMFLTSVLLNIWDKICSEGGLTITPTQEATCMYNKYMVHCVYL